MTCAEKIVIIDFYRQIELTNQRQLFQISSISIYQIIK